MLSSYGTNRLLRRVIEAFFRHQKLFWISAIGISGIVSMALLLRGNSYTASASTRISSDKEISEVLGFDKQTIISPAQTNVDRFNDLLKDDTPGGFVDRTLTAAKLKVPINVDPRYRDKRLELLRKKLTVAVDSGEVFRIQLIWDNAAECERIVGAFQDSYIEEAGTVRQATALATTRLLDSQIQDYLKRMRVAEQALIDYKQANAGKLPEAQTADIEQLALLKKDRDALLISSKDNELRKQQLQARLAELKPTTVESHLFSVPGSSSTDTAANAAGPAAPPDSPYHAEILALQNKRTAFLVGGYRPDGTDVQNLDRQISQLQDREREEAERASKNSPPTVAGNVAGARVVQTTLNNPEYIRVADELSKANIGHITEVARLGLVEKTITEYEQRIQKLPSAVRELNDKTRDYSILKTQYDNLLERREQAKIKAALDRVAARSTLKEIGSIYAEPSLTKAKSLLMLIGSLIFGLIVGFGLITLGEWLDPTLRYEEDIEHLLGVPVLLSLPLSQAALALPTPSAPSRRAAPAAAIGKKE